MKTIKFVVMGNKNVGKSALVQLYLWKLKYGCAYHDHTIEKIRYLIDAVEVESFEELQGHLKEHCLIKNIYFVCFNVNDRQTLQAARNTWILELLNHNPKTKVFLIGLQCDLREQILKKLKKDCVSYSDGVSISRYYANVHYMECSSNDQQSVQDLFDEAIRKVLYEDDGSKDEKIVAFYEQIQISFQFKDCDCKFACKPDECTMD